MGCMFRLQGKGVCQRQLRAAIPSELPSRACATKNEGIGFGDSAGVLPRGRRVWGAWLVLGVELRALGFVGFPKAL